jgi:putative membrane protein
MVCPTVPCPVLPVMHTHPHTLASSLAGTAVLAVIALLYLLRARREHLPAARVAAMMGGLTVLWAALFSPLAALDHRLLTFHMVKHLLLMTIAPPLLFWGLPRRWRRRPPVNALVCWFASAATVILWHVPAVFQLALRSQACHYLELATFLAAGVLFWWPVMLPGGDARSDRSLIPLYLFAATFPCDALSAFLAFCGRAVYPNYLSAEPLFHLSPLDDQQVAGALMWVVVTVIYLVPAVAITVQMLGPRPLDTATTQAGQGPVRIKSAV